MNLAHLHLLLNHVPVIGTIVAVLLLAYALWRKSAELTRVALGMFVILAFFGLAVYLTGEPAEHVAQRLPGVTRDAIHEHEEAGLIAAWLLGAVGALSLGGLIDYRRRPEGVPRRFGFILLILSLFPALAMARTANLGGMVRHSEIRSDTTGAAVIQPRPNRSTPRPASGDRP
jgi:hypothetical protein